MMIVEVKKILRGPSLQEMQKFWAGEKKWIGIVIVHWLCRKREEVVEEVDDVISSQRNQHSRRTVDRPGRPSAEAAERSTGPVDRRARTCTTDMHGVYRSTARSTDWKCLTLG